MLRKRNGKFPVQVLLTPEQYEKARKLAYKKGVTVNELLKLLLIEKK